MATLHGDGRQHGQHPLVRERVVVFGRDHPVAQRLPDRVELRVFPVDTGLQVELGVRRDRSGMIQQEHVALGPDLDPLREPGEPLEPDLVDQGPDRGARSAVTYRNGDRDQERLRVRVPPVDPRDVRRPVPREARVPVAVGEVHAQGLGRPGIVAPQQARRVGHEGANDPLVRADEASGTGHAPRHGGGARQCAG